MPHIQAYYQISHHGVVICTRNQTFSQGHTRGKIEIA